MIWHAIAIAAGILLGAIFHLIFRKIALPAASKRYWRQMGVHAIGVLKGDESRFWFHYGRLAMETARYVTRQLAALLAASTPLLIFAAGFRGPGRSLLAPSDAGWLPHAFNPLRAVLSDLELIFFLFFSVTTLAMELRVRRGSKPDPGPSPLGLVDYSLTWIAARHAGGLRRCGGLESRLLDRKLAKIPVVQPVFIAGLARSGTTLLLEVLAQAPRVATHRYRDFPFIMTPVLWNLFTTAFAIEQKAVERPHGDRIRITRESPEAFEEPIWQLFFPHVHDPGRSHRLTAADANPAFDRFYIDHIRKILLIRAGTRYLAKGNYNLGRIEYLCRLFEDARFIIPIRHPMTQIVSLTRQHERFCAFGRTSPQVPAYLSAAGHYEFGPQRRPQCLYSGAGDEIQRAWASGGIHLGYAIQWAHVYRFVSQLAAAEELRSRIHVLRYEDLCASPENEIEKALRFAALEASPAIEAAIGRIAAPAGPLQMTDSEGDRCWQAVASVAARYGYTRDPDRRLPLARRQTDA